MSKTVKVRIFIAVDSDGVWNSVGYGAMDDSDVGNCLEFFDDGKPQTHAWVTAEIPIPETALELAGTVETSRVSEPVERSEPS